MSLQKYIMLGMVAGIFISSEMQAPGRQTPPLRKEQPENQPGYAAHENPIAEVGEKPLTPKQEIAQFKKNISVVRKDMFEAVDQISKGVLSDKVQLLQNILSHEQQSLASLRAHLVKKQPLKNQKIEDFPDFRQGGLFPGCPMCG